MLDELEEKNPVKDSSSSNELVKSTKNPKFLKPHDISPKRVSIFPDINQVAPGQPSEEVDLMRNDASIESIIIPDNT